MFEQLIFAVGVTGPVLVILLLGLFFRRIDWIDANFIAVGNKLVFNVTLPCVLFLGTASRPLKESLDVSLVAFGLVFTVVAVVVLYLAAPLLVVSEKRGIFVQGAFRGNLAIVGMAFVINAYGEGIVPKAGVYLALLTILYNILAVWLLRSREHNYLATLTRNPLIIAIFLGLSYSGLGFELPALIANTGKYFSQMSLPLALLCIGGSLHWDSVKANHRDVMWASACKLMLVPGAATAAALIGGFKGEDLGILFMMMSAPTAAASYIMARQMTTYGEMAAEIVAVTTSLSAVTVTIGLVMLRSSGYI